MAQLSPEEKLVLAEAGMKDPVFFCKTFLSHWFSSEIPWVHRGILAILTRKSAFLKDYGELDKIISNFTYKADPGDTKSAELPIFTLEVDGTISMVVGRFTQIMLPRGFSKTTLANAASIYNTAYQYRQFALYLSESGGHSANQLATVKREFEENQEFREVFGELKPPRNSTRRWTEYQMETQTGIKFVAKGRGGQIRGTSVSSQRPDFILMDDVEDEESVQTEEQRKKALKWAFEAVIPALPPLDKNASIVALGTLLHKDAMLQKFSESPEWTTIRFGVLDKQGDPLWPEAMNHREIELKKASFQRVNNMAGFYREYHNQLRDDSSAKFKQRYINVLGDVPPDIVAKALAVDPAISDAKTSDFFAVGVTGMRANGRLIVLDVDGERGVSPRDQIDWIFEWWKKWGMTPSDYCGIESIAYQRALIHLVKEEMFRKKMYFEVKPITHGNTAKHVRVEGILQPRYAAGYIDHRISFPLYEQQLLDWPNDKLDLPDVVSMSIGLLDPHAAQAGGADLAKDQYKPLNKVVGGNFRSAP